MQNYWRSTNSLHLINVATLPCEFDNRHLLQSTSHKWQLQVQLNHTGLAIYVQVFNWSTTVRKVVVIAENTMSKSNTVLEMTVAGLDARWEMMHWSCNDDVIQLSSLSSYAVLEFVEISNAYYVHLLLHYVPTL